MINVWTSSLSRIHTEENLFALLFIVVASGGFYVASD